MTVEHNDLHTDNVFAGPGAAPGSAPPGLRIFDWADAVISHPFICLGRARRIGLENDEGEIDDAAPVDPAVLRDAYLRCWLPTAQLEIPAEFRRSAEFAEALSNIALAASWLRLRPGFEPRIQRLFRRVGHRLRRSGSPVGRRQFVRNSRNRQLSGRNRKYVQGLPGSDGASLRCVRPEYNNGIRLLTRLAMHPSAPRQPLNNFQFRPLRCQGGFPR